MAIRGPRLEFSVGAFLLPALPAAWLSGQARGLCARGGFEVDLQWQDGRLREATIRSRVGGPCRVRCGDKSVEFRTEAGESYPVQF